MRVSLALAAFSVAAAADKRLAEAAARSRAADDLLVRLDAPGHAVPAPEPLSVDVPPRTEVGLLRALGAWLLSWPLDGFARAKMKIARDELRARAAARDRPSARPRDGPR